MFFSTCPAVPLRRSQHTEEVSLESWDAGHRGRAPGVGTWVALAVGVLALLLYQPLSPGILHDDGVYLMLARGVAEGHGYVYHGVPGTPPGAKFPPIYSALLALYWTVTGGDLAAVSRLAVATNLLALVGLAAALARFARIHLGLPRSWSLGCGLMMGLPAAPWSYALLPLSDAPGLLLGVLLVGAATRLERAPPGERGRPTLCFLLLFLVAFHLRTALLVVGVAGVLGVWARGMGENPGEGIRRGVAGALPAGVGVLLLALPWLILSRLWTERIPPEFRDLLGGYGDWLGSMAGVGLGPLDGVGPRLLRMVEEVAGALVPGVPGALRWGMILLLLPLLALGLANLWRHSRSALLALGLLALQVVLWPFVDQRMVLPLLPWLVLAVVAGGYRAGSTFQAPLPRGGTALPVLASASLAAWISVLTISLGLQATRPDGIIDSGVVVRGVALEEVVGAIREEVPPGEVVGAPEFWAILHLRTGHPVVPSARFRPGMGRKAVGTPAEQHRQWGVGRVAALVDEGGLHRAALDALAQRCGEGAWQVAREGVGYRLILLTWDARCRRTVIPDWQEGLPGS